MRMTRRTASLLAAAALTTGAVAPAARAAVLVDGEDSQTWTSPTITHTGYFDVVAVTGSTPDNEDDVAAFNVGLVVPAAAQPHVRFTGVSALPGAQSGFAGVAHYPIDDPFPRADLLVGADVAAGAVDLSDLPGLFRVHYQVLPGTPAGTYPITFDATVAELVDADANLLTGVAFDDALVTVTVPEPTTATLAALTGAALLLRRRRRAGAL